MYTQIYLVRRSAITKEKILQMNKDELLETGGGRYLFVNAAIHDAWQQLSETDQSLHPLSGFATHGNINYIGRKWMNKWPKRYSPSSTVCVLHLCCSTECIDYLFNIQWTKYMATGKDRRFTDNDIMEHVINLLSDSDKRWGIDFVNDDVDAMPLSLEEGYEAGKVVGNDGSYGRVRGQRGCQVTQNENSYY